MSIHLKMLRTLLLCSLFILAAIFLVSCGAGSLFENFDDTPYTGEINIKMPEAPGTVTFEKGGVSFDVSNASEGYFAASCSGIDKKLKLRVATPDGKFYDYDINNEGRYEFFPFSEGDGLYTATLYEQVSGNEYGLVYGIEIDVLMGDVKTPFTYPNQRVNFDSGKQAVYMSYQLTQKYTDDADKIEVLYRYVATQIVYDDEFAQRVRNKEISSDYIPDPDNTLATGTGICYDYSVLLGTMLRAQGIPTQLVIGELYQDGEVIPHAWNLIWDGRQWVMYDATLYGGNQQPEDYTDRYYY